jgi:hypothetical protein
MSSLFEKEPDWSQWIEAQFPPGTPVVVRQRIDRRGQPLEVEIAGTVLDWLEQPTGSWYAHGKHDRLWLKRLVLRKVDGEQTVLVIDDATMIAKLEAAAPSSVA